MQFIIGILKESYVLFNEMSPYLLLGFIFAGILHVFLSIEMIGKHLGGRGIGSVVKSVVLGIPLPLCSCGVIPAAVLLRRSGASRGSVVSFLIATPITGVDSIFATYSLLGLFFTVYRVIASSVTAVVAGVFANLISYGKSDGHLDKNESEGESCPHCTGEENKAQEKRGFRDFLHYAFIRSIGDIYKWLVLGTVIGGVIAYMVPPSFVENYLSNSFVSMLVMLIVGIPMYVCSTGSIPIAASMLMIGISPGAALVFLLAGPATNAVTITVVAKELGKKATSIYVGVIALMSIIMGYLMDLLPDAMGLEDISHHIHEGILPSWLHLASTAILLFLIFVALIRNLRGKISGRE